MFLPICSTHGSAEELDIVNRPVNISGLTGLLFTTAPYTLPKGVLETGGGILTESSITPNFSMTEVPVSVSIGVTNNSELAVRSSYLQIKEVSSSPTGTVTSIERKTGDLEVSYKWNFLPQPEDSIRPALALIIAGMVPTEDNSDRTISAVVHWGMRLGLSTGTEISWKEHILGVYADAQAVAQDPLEKRLRDIYGVYNAGILLPVSKYRNLQMFIEYTLVNGRNEIIMLNGAPRPVNGGDYYGITYGIRLVNERFNVTIGTQYVHKHTKDLDNTSRLIALMSMKF